MFVYIRTCNSPRDPSLYVHSVVGTGSCTTSTTNMDKKHVPPGLVGNVAAFLVQQFRQSGQHFQIGRRSDVVMPFHFLAILLQQEMVKRRLPQKQVSQEQLPQEQVPQERVS